MFRWDSISCTLICWGGQSVKDTLTWCFFFFCEVAKASLVKMLFRKKYCYFMILGSSYSLTHSRNQSFNHSFRCSDFYICFDFQWINIAGYKPKTQVQLMQRSPSNSKKTSKPTSSRFLLFCSEHLNCPKSMNPKIVLRLLSKIKRIPVILGQLFGIVLPSLIYCAGGICLLFINII